MKRDWSTINRTIYYAVLSEKGKILPRTIRTKPGDSEAELFTNPGLAHRNDPTKTKTVRVKVTVLDQPQARELLLDEATVEIEACHAMLTEALGFVEVDVNPHGQDFQDRLVAFLQERDLYRPPSESI